MDWGVVIFAVGFIVCWCCCVWTGFNLGIKYERFRRDKEVDAYVIPEENLQDGAYWKMRYEELSQEWEELNAKGRYAPGETTE